MNKTELINKLSILLNCDKRMVKSFLTVLNGEISGALEKDGKITIKDFGTFSLWEQTERNGRNPKTGQICTIPARFSVKFKPGKGLQERLNKKKPVSKKDADEL